MLPLAIVLLIVSQKWWKLLFILEIVFLTLILFLVNYSIVWWAVIVGSALIMVFGIIKRDLFDGRWMALPIFFLVVSLFFVLLKPQINLLSQKPNEIFLSQSVNFQIALQTLKEKPVFGSGPGTFAYDFSKYKSPDFNKSALWNITFNKGSSKVLNDLVTTGVLGFLALLALITFPIFYGIKFLIVKKEVSKFYWILALGLSACLTVQGLTYFLYNSNMVLDFACFFLIASLIGLISKEKKTYELKSSSLTTLIITFIFTLVFIFGLGLLILNSQRYTAEINYYIGLASWQVGNKDLGTKSLESAASLNPSSDLYFRQLSMAYLVNVQDKLQNSNVTPSDEEAKKIQTLIANSINAAKIATDLNPNDVNNWSVRGYVYQNLFGMINDAGTWANTSYDEAIKLSPNNPYLLLQKGNVFLSMALKLTQAEAQQKNQLLLQAQEQLEKAINLNPNYSNAIYSLGLVFDTLGQKDKAIEQFKKVQQLDPKNTNISKILDNLNAGLPALQAATSPITLPPVEGTSNSIKTTPKTK
jgi:tetratricopeptide (TPR) repeat protein